MLFAAVAVCLPIAWIALRDYVAPTTVDDKMELVSRAAQIAGAAFFALGLYWTARNVHVNREGQITDRYIRATDQLGATNVDGTPRFETRLGAIYALERIARDSSRDQKTIMDVLSAYVRQHASPSPRGQEHQADLGTAGGPEQATPRADVQAALTVIGRRKHTRIGRGEKAIDLGYADLRGYDLTYADLSGIWLYKTNLAGSILTYANLEQAFLIQTTLTGANLDGTRFAGAWLIGTDLSNARNLDADQFEDVRWDVMTTFPPLVRAVLGEPNAKMLPSLEIVTLDRPEEA
jgi:hypothetical protein